MAIKKILLLGLGSAGDVHPNVGLGVALLTGWTALVPSLRARVVLNQAFAAVHTPVCSPAK